MAAILRSGAVSIAAVAALATSACDWFTTYTVENRTDEPLIITTYMEGCSSPVGYREDYLHEEFVQPGETREYSDTHDGPRPGCVLAMGLDRTLVFAAPYEAGRTYTIAPPVQPAGPVLPEPESLPSQPFSEKVEDLGQLQTAVMAVLAVIAGLLFLLGVYLAGKWFARLVLRPA